MPRPSSGSRDQSVRQIGLPTVKRRTVSLSEEARATLEHHARTHRSYVSCVVEAAVGAIESVGTVAQEVELRIVSDRRGGRRNGAGRKRSEEPAGRKSAR